MFHEGWSPIFIALRAQLIRMINIRRSLCGYRDIYWDEDQRTQNITSLVGKWRGIVDRFTFESEEAKLAVMSWTGTAPSYWTDLEAVDRQILLSKHVKK